MKIAQIAPLSESVPPKLYGGTERVVHFLTEELVRLGHDVTLFASGDSQTSARLIACAEQALRLDGNKDPLMPNMIMLDKVRQHADQYDILHFHIDVLHYPMLRMLDVAALTTLHGRLDLPRLAEFYGHFPELPLVSISRSQRDPLPSVNWVGNVYHGLPLGLLKPTVSSEERYLAFLGRISPEKRPDRAIEIAIRSGKQLRIAAKIDAVDRGYWEEAIEPLIAANPNISFVGEIDEGQKEKFLGNAAALLFPIDWPEPFGLVMAEAMACGTPVIAFDRGSVSEVVDHGVSGFIVDSIDQAVDAVATAETIDREKVRATFERRFSVTRMAQDYVKIYLELTSRSKVRESRPPLYAVEGR